MDSGFLRFLLIALSIWGVLHAYVFWRLASLPWLTSKVPPSGLALIGVALWLSYFLARLADAKGLEALARFLEPFAAAWVGLAFILFSLLLLTELVAFVGRMETDSIVLLRSLAVLAASALALGGTVQALRQPMVREAEVLLPHLPEEHDGLEIVLLSDLHLGTLLGGNWLKRVIDQVNGLAPDLVAIAGDIADHDYERVRALIPLLQSIRAPLGVWAVTGNHDAYAGLERMHRLMREAGFNVLADRSAEVVPGLVIAGVDDFEVPRPGLDSPVEAIDGVLADHAGSAVILLSHTPLGIELAEQRGAGLMLCGHTHGGQIWPFNHLVRTQFKHVGGRYQIGDMTLIVCRGTGTWGPRMRVWRPSEMWHIRLKAAE